MTVDPATTAAAVVEMARHRRFAEIEDLFAPPLRAVVAAGTVRAAWDTEISRHGALLAIGAPVSEPAKARLVRVSVAVTCEHGGLAVVMSVDGAGLLHGLRISPAVSTSWTPPAYAEPETFTERDAMVGSGPLAVPGTVSLPHGRGLRPGVVLLGSGGPFDRDETSGPNKPLKDLAWGLASHGVAVLRFDKVTCTHPARVAHARGFTIAEEYVPHAVAAVHRLQNQPGVGPVFVLGHSAGGRVAPRVAAAQASIAGLVILAGDTQPMHEAAIRVARYLATLNPGPRVDMLMSVAAASGRLPANICLGLGSRMSIAMGEPTEAHGGQGSSVAGGGGAAGLRHNLVTPWLISRPRTSAALISVSC